jgi:hypothetical protein
MTRSRTRWPVKTPRLSARDRDVGRALAAYHEAAHAVVAIAHGLDVTMATIAPRKGDLGHVEIEMPSPEVCVGISLPAGLSRTERRAWINGWRAAMLGCAQVYLAGLAAESMLSEGLAIPSDDPDYVGARQYIAAFCHRFGMRGQIGELFDDLWEATKRLLRQGWETVEKVARALLTHTTLKWGRKRARRPEGSSEPRTAVAGRSAALRRRR